MTGNHCDGDLGVAANLGVHLFKLDESQVAQQVKCWPTDLAIPGSSHA